MAVLEKMEVLDKVSSGLRIAAVMAWTNHFIKKTEGKVRGNVKVSVPSIVDISYVSLRDPVLGNMEDIRFPQRFVSQ
jgi:hypothetical protein